MSDWTLNTNTLTDYAQEARLLAVRIQQMRLGRGKQLEGATQQLNAKDLAGLHTLLASMLRYEPSERATAEEVIKQEWVQQVLQKPEI